MKRLLFSTLFLLFCAASSQAMPGGMSGGFDRADADKDGSLSWDEFHAAFSSLKREAFDLIDAGRDGRISQEEWKAFRVNHGMSGTPGQQSKGGMNGTSGTTGATGGLPLLDAPPASPPSSAATAATTPAAQAAPAAQGKSAPLPLLNAPAK